MSAEGLRRLLVALIWVLTMLCLALPASAHEEHKKKEQAAQQAQQDSPGGRTSEVTQLGPTAAHGQMGELMDPEEADRSSMSLGMRFLDWLGRLHPTIVHFPIAFFPAALFTAIVGRRRPAFAAPVQFLVVAGGIIAPIAALLGWLDAMSADPDPLLTVHRWLGTAIGIGGLGLAAWALLRPDQDRNAGMIVGLAVITAAIVVQGWYGGALVHGIEHLNM